MSDTEITGRLYDIQSFSVHDGPGVRTTVFLKGCPLRCLWCHSPESQSFAPQMGYTPLKCIGTALCGECLKVCPSGALEPGEPTECADGETKRLIRWDRKKCIDCAACDGVCFPEALHTIGRDYTVQEVMDILRKDYAFFRDGGGGVTISGGEALGQPDFTEALLKALRADGIHTALDTTGFAPEETLLRMLPHTDLFLYDLKHMDPLEHKRGTGVPNGQIHANARLIAARGGKMQIRIPVIPGYNDSEENLRQTAAFCRELGDAVTLVQLLPYHHLGTAKYQRIQKHDPMPDALQPPTEEEMQRHLELFAAYGLQVVIH